MHGPCGVTGGCRSNLSRTARMSRDKNPSGAPRSQSAMEYLMTYGWAILIIAVVLGALYYLGVFGSATSRPRAQPGSCKVIRPLGPGTTAYINLVGVCTGQLPQYVGSFNGQGSYINLGQIKQEAGMSPVSFAVWFDTISFTTAWTTVFGDTCDSPRNGYFLYFGNSGAGQGPSQLAFGRMAGGTENDVLSISNVPFNTWYQAVMTYDGSTMRLYLNGVLQNSKATSVSVTVTDPMTLGGLGSNGAYACSYANQQAADFQIYNTSLDASAVQSLYAEGIGGAPIPSPYLVGWWPLNGNANDYSGNNNNGVPTSVTYTSTWTK